jgi:hypothetical protein
MQLNFRKNLSDKDRIIRIVIALVLLSLMAARVVTGWWALLFGLLAVSQFVEAILAY